LHFEIIQHAFGVKTKVMEDCIPENAQAKVIFSSRIFVAIWIANYSVVFSCIPLGCQFRLFCTYHNFMEELYTNWLPLLSMRVLARNIKDHRFSTREMYLNPILSFLYWKMEYHVTHHMFPTVPSYNLDKLHHHIKDQLPRTK
jgi:fatty acid desaturase